MMAEYFDYFRFVFLFLTGTVFGSFLNVVIYRLPKNLSLIKPASHCPYCQSSIRWYNNIPLLSYIFLKGKCSNCKEKISFQYPLVEFLTGLIFVILPIYTTGIFQFIVLAIMAMIFLCLIFIDFKYYLLPDILLILILLMSLIYFGYQDGLKVFTRIFYGLVIGLSFYVLRLVTSRFYKKETFGLGDIKLSAIVGFLLGLSNAYIAIFFGFIIAAVIFSVLMIAGKVKRNDYMPFGPYIIFGTIIYLLCGDKIIQWYLGVFI